jgi:NAD(P)-dependent dehydrogenase (short-subunit alcohol dehydrogenase family)
MRLAGKVALITGAARGIGRAEAKLFAEEGATVVISDIEERECQNTVAGISANGGQASYFVAEISEATRVKELFDFVLDTYGKLNILVNNAGVFFRNQGDGPIVDAEETIWDKTMTVNLKSVFLCCKQAIPLMIKAGGGSIVTTASTAAVRGSRAVAYGSSKGGIVALTKSIAVCYAKDNVRANVICPAFVDTEMTRGAFGTQAVAMAELTSRVPLGRLADPVEIAYPALFLASDESSFMTGSVLVVDGGATA